MPLCDDLTKEVKEIVSRQWTTRDGRVVPTPGDVAFANEGVRLDATVLYADLGESTSLVDEESTEFSAEVYKCYLHCAAKIIKSENGEITAYDGDRIMAIFLGDYKNQSAARTALKINHAVTYIINPALKDFYKTSYEVKQVVGVDTSQVLAVQTGIRGSTDLVWIGRAANHAAKLSALNPDFPSRITKEVFDRLPVTGKVYSGRSMWSKATWTAMEDRSIYRSTWTWPV